MGHNKMKSLPIIMSFLLLGGCSALPSAKKLAEQGDWAQLGFTDGEQGLPKRSAAELAALHPTDQTSLSNYSSSYQQGLSIFCTPEKGFYHGVTGRLYEGQCDHFAHAAELVKSWNEGLDQYEYEQFQQMIQESEQD